MRKHEGIVSTRSREQCTTEIAVTDLLAGSGEAAGLPALVDGVGDPVDLGVAANGLVGGVDEDDLEVLVHTVLVDPVRLLKATGVS